MRNCVILESVVNLTIITNRLKSFPLRLAPTIDVRRAHQTVGRSYISPKTEFYWK